MGTDLIPELGLESETVEGLLARSDDTGAGAE